jgi:hypothetical protein
MILVRLVHFVLVGGLGAFGGGVLGFLFGALIDYAIGPPEPGGALTAYSLGLSWLGVVIGGIGSVVWLSTALGKETDDRR